MRAGAAAVQHTLTPPAQQVLKHAIGDARARGHAQVQPLHVASMLLAHGGSPLRHACAVSHPQSPPHGLQQCRALELCFNVALDRLPQSSSSTTSSSGSGGGGQLGLSNALVAALKRAQAHQRRGCPEQQQPPLLALKVEIEQLIISILDDPSVSRVMREAGFSSTQVKLNLEDAMGLTGPPPPDNANPFSYKMGAAGGMFGSPRLTDAGGEVKASPFLLKGPDPAGPGFPMLQPGGESPCYSRVHSVLLGRSPPQLPATAPELPPTPTRDEEVRRAIDVLLRPPAAAAKRNPILVADSLASATAAFRQLQSFVKSNDAPEPLRHIPILTPELSSLSFASRSRQEMEQKLAELGKIVDECMPRGCILHIGDLQWFVDPVPQNVSGPTYCAAKHTAIELGHMLERHKGSRRLWFVGVASSQCYLQCQALHPTLESKWGLQHVPVASPANFGLNSRFAKGISSATSSGLSPLGRMGGARPPPPSPMARLPPHGSSIDAGQKPPCCPDCTAQLDAECKQLQDQERALDPSPSCSAFPPDAPSQGSKPAEASAAAAAPLPSWLQKEKDMKSEQVKNQSLLQKTQELHQKWQSTCRTLHPHRHGGNPASAPANVTLNPSPLSRMNANMASTGKSPGLMMSTLTYPPPNAVCGSVAPRPSPMSPLPQWARGLVPGAAAPSSPLASKKAAPEAPPPAMIGIMGMRVSPPQVVDKSSSKDGSRSSVASALEDPEDRSTETSAEPEGFGMPISINLALGRPGGPSPFAKARLGSLQECQQQRAAQWQQAHRERLQDPSGGACPLRGGPQGPSPLATALRPMKPTARSPLAMTPLPYAPLNQSLNPRPPPAFSQRAADGLKHLYKGLLERVPWQGEAVAAVATAVMNARSGLGKLRGVSAKADTWLLFLGPDRVGKRLMANALAELVFGGDKKPVRFGLPRLARGGWGQEDGGGDVDVARYRGRTPLDKVAEALKSNPLCVLLLEDIDHADAVLRMSLARAMETGKLADSSGRQVSISNAIVVMTSAAGAAEPPAEAGKKEIPLCEEKLASLGGARVRVVLEPRGDRKVVFRGGPKIAVVEHADCSADVAVGAKRKADGPAESAPFTPDEKRMRVMSSTGRAIALDLNMAAMDDDEVDDAGGLEEPTSVGCQSDAPTRESTLSAARASLTPKFCSLVDDALVFEPYDTTARARRVLSQLSRACASLTAEGAAPAGGGGGVEVEFSVLEHMVASVWQTPGGDHAFDTWLKEKLETSLQSLTTAAKSTPSEGNMVLKFLPAAAPWLTSGPTLEIDAGSGRC